MGKTAQEFVSSIMVDDGLADDGTKSCHALPEPRWNAAAMEGKIGAAGSLCHSSYRFLRWVEHSVRSARNNGKIRSARVVLGTRMLCRRC